MSPAPWRWLLVGTAACLALGASWALGEEMFERITRLRNEGHYDLALGLVDDHAARGLPMDRQLSWLRAQLTPDPDRFDRLSGELVGGQSPDDSLVQAIVLERAREQFARGQYLAALENLEALPIEAVGRHPDLALFKGMAAGAVGQNRKATEAFLLIDASSPSYAMGQAMLAGVSLRKGDTKAAVSHAETALTSDAAAVGPQALFVRAQALEQMGEETRARRSWDELLRNHGSSAEAAWARELGAVSQNGASSLGSQEALIDEVEAPKRRLEFSLQFGAFHDRSLALRKALSLKGQVDELRIERDTESSPPWYRVVAGNYPTRTMAETAQAQLSSKGHDGVVLSPGLGGP